MALSFEAFLRRRDRKRRNQGITAGVVGIAVFVAAIWIVTSGGPFDRSTPAVPGSETRPTQTSPTAARASAAPEDEVRTGTCSDGARWRLELTDMGVAGPIVVRFELHRSPVGHEWRIELRHRGYLQPGGRVFFRGTRVASDGGDLAVVRRHQDTTGPDGVAAEATDTQTGQVCRAFAQV